MTLTNSPFLVKYLAMASIWCGPNAVRISFSSTCFSCSFILDVSIRNGF